MHELSLMLELRDQALEAAFADGARRIERVSLRVGALAGVEIEALRLAFPMVMAGTIGAEAELRIETEPAICRCGGCGVDYTANDGICLCPQCDWLGGQLRSGKALQLVALEVS